MINSPENENLDINQLRRVEIERLSNAKQRFESEKFRERRKKITRLRNYRKNLSKKLKRFNSKLKETGFSFRNAIFQERTLFYLTFGLSIYNLDRRLKTIQNQLVEQKIELVRLQSQLTGNQEKSSKLIQKIHWPSVMIISTSILNKILEASQRKFELKETRVLMEKIDQKITSKQDKLYQKEIESQKLLKEQLTYRLEQEEERKDLLNSLLQEMREKGENKAKINNLEKKLKDSEKKVIDLKAEEISLKTINSQLTKTKNKTLTQLAKSEAENSSLKEKAKQNFTIRKKLETEIQNYQKEISLLRRKLRDSEKREISEIKKIHQLEGKVNQNRKKIFKLEQENIRLEGLYTTKEDQLNSQKEICSALQSDYNNRISLTEDLQKELERLEIKFLRAEKNSDREKNKLAAEIRSREKTLSKAKQGSLKSLRKFEEQNIRLQKLEEERFKAEEKSKKMEGEYNQKKRKLKTVEDSYSELKDRILQQEQKNAQLNGKLQLTNDQLNNKTKELKFIQEDQIRFEEELKNKEEDYRAYIQFKLEYDKEYQKELTKKEKELEKVQNQWWRKLLNQSSVNFDFGKKNREPKTEKTRLYLNPLFGPFGGNLITEKSRLEPKAWGEIPINETKNNSNSKFIQEVQNPLN